MTFRAAFGALVVEGLPGVQEVTGTIPGWVISKTFELMIDAQHLKVRQK